MKIKFLIISLTLLCNLMNSQSQSELLKNFGATNCNVLKVIYDWQSRGGYSTRKEKIAKQWPVTIERDANQNITKIIIMRSGIIEEVFTPDILNYSTYFTNGVDRLTYVNGNLFYYQAKQSTYDVSDQVKYVLYTEEKTLSTLPETFSDWTGLMDYFN